MSIEIDQEKKQVTVKVNLDFYHMDKIVEAAQEFTDSCYMNLEEQEGKHVLVTIKPKSDEIDLDTVGNEFYNFVLGLMKNASVEE